jgi:uncharacterized protein (TIGR00251 family)
MAGSTLLSVRVTPRSSKDEIGAWDGSVLRVKLRAPPVDGRANEALRRLLAEHLGLAPSSVEVVSGATSRIKRLRIEGIAEAELREKLGG